jgi:hypothetical protein
MKKLLHILTRPDDALAAEIIVRQQGNGENNVVVMDLTAPADYKELLENIFAADSVQAW